MKILQIFFRELDLTTEYLTSAKILFCYGFALMFCNAGKLKTCEYVFPVRQDQFHIEVI